MCVLASRLSLSLSTGRGTGGRQQNGYLGKTHCALSGSPGSPKRRSGGKEEMEERKERGRQADGGEIKKLRGDVVERRVDEID